VGAGYQYNDPTFSALAYAFPGAGHSDWRCTDGTDIRRCSTGTGRGANVSGYRSRFSHSSEQALSRVITAVTLSDYAVPPS